MFLDSCALSTKPNYACTCTCTRTRTRIRTCTRTDTDLHFDDVAAAKLSGVYSSFFMVGRLVSIPLSARFSAYSLISVNIIISIGAPVSYTHLTLPTTPYV